MRRAVGTTGQIILGTLLLFTGTAHLTFAGGLFGAGAVLTADRRECRCRRVRCGRAVPRGGSARHVEATRARHCRGTVTAAFVAILPGNIVHFTEHRVGFGLDTDAARTIRLLFQPLLVLWALAVTSAVSTLRSLRRRHDTSQRNAGEDTVRRRAGSARGWVYSPAARPRAPPDENPSRSRERRFAQIRVRTESVARSVDVTQSRRPATPIRWRSSTSPAAGGWRSSTSAPGTPWCSCAGRRNSTTRKGSSGFRTTAYPGAAERQLPPGNHPGGGGRHQPPEGPAPRAAPPRPGRPPGRRHHRADHRGTRTGITITASCWTASPTRSATCRPRPDRRADHSPVHPGQQGGTAGLVPPHETGDGPGLAQPQAWQIRRGEVRLPGRHGGRAAVLVPRRDRRAAAVLPHPLLDMTYRTPCAR